MRAKPCQSADPDAFLACDFCGTRQEFLDHTLFVEGTSEAAICGRCVDRLSERLDHLRSNEAIEMPATEQFRNSVALKEKNIEQCLYDALCEAGIAVERQKRTPVGIADLVLDDTVIEVKVAIRTRREFHQAAGQARAYADAIGKQRAFVVASEIAETLAGYEAMGVGLSFYDEVLPLLQAQEV